MSTAEAPDTAILPTQEVFPSFAAVIPLDQLILSKLNVRHTERDADVASLAEDIAARGLKQNLVVIPAHFTTGEVNEPWEGHDRWAGKFEVIAGGRRLQALKLLACDGRIEPDLPISCLVEPRTEASETSLSENLHRVAMNPADEFDAFAVIVADQLGKGRSEPDAVAYTAKRFGVTASHVQGRLRLAGLAPDILEALRKGAIGVDSAKAYAGSADQELQIKVFLDQCKPGVWRPHDPATVRAALRGITLPVDHPLMKFVGLDAYLAAGGRTEMEMFMGTDGGERVLDIKLLQKLATAAAEPLVAPAAKKDGFKSGLLATGAGAMAKWPKAPAGFERYVAYYQSAAPTKKELKASIAVYAIAHDGVGLQKIGHFKPIVEKEQEPARDWDIERAAQLREWAIQRKAAQMALGSFIGTPMEGKAYWPDYQVRPVEDHDADDTMVLVAVQIAVSRADADAHLAEAERLYDEAMAAQQAAQAEEAQANG